MIVIGLVGQKQAGKDTVADYLVKSYGFQKVAFADPLKEMCKAMYCLDDPHFHNAFMKEAVVPYWGKSPRQMMQYVGTELVRNHLDPDFWIKHAKFQLEKNKYEKVVFSDVRFQNEAAFVKSLGGKLFRVRRAWNSSGSSSSNNNSNNVGEDKHQTETEQFGIGVDGTVINGHKGFQELYDKVDKILADEYSD